MKRSVFAAFLVGMGLGLAGPAGATEAELALGLEHIQERRHDAARAAMTRIADPIMRDILMWHLIRDRSASWAEATEFLDRNPHWPNQVTLRRQTERVMPVALPPEDVLGFFSGRAPVSPEGALRMALAFRVLGREAEAEALAIDTWLSKPMGTSAHRGFLAVFGDLLAPYHAARLDSLIWSGDLQSAGRTLPLVEGPERALAEARIALREDRPGVDALIEAVPEDLRDHPGLAYERFLWRLSKGRRDGENSALDILFAFDDSADSLARPDAWGRQRERIARGLMQDGQPDLAYRVASRHFMEDGDRPLAQVEWLAGYIALRHLEDPAAAAQHFARFEDNVISPISAGRAGYWLGRALEAGGELPKAAEAYVRGAKYQTSFYGQLAAERVGLPTDPRLTGTEQFPPLAQTSASGSTALQAARLLAQIGQRDLSERFAIGLADTLSRAEIGAVLDEILSWGEPHVALRVAKRAAQRGFELHRGYYPLTPLAQLDSSVAPELSLSIARRESEFDPIVVSPAGARGLMQLMPGTAQEMAGVIGVEYEQWRLTDDALYNARLGTAYLAELESEFGRSLVLVPAAYNAGPSRARSWRDRFGDPAAADVDIVDWIEDVPFSETRNYIMRVSESLLPYRSQLRGEVEPIRLTDWLRSGYGQGAGQAASDTASDG